MPRIFDAGNRLQKLMETDETNMTDERDSWYLTVEKALHRLDLFERYWEILGEPSYGNSTYIRRLKEVADKIDEED